MIRLLILLLISTPALAQDGGIDAPRILRLPGDKYLFNQPAFDALDTEMKRLQAREREHKAEQWLPVLLIGAAVGLVVGGAAVGAAWFLSANASPATPPSP